MLDKGIKVLKELEKNGFEAYIVGGFVRDYLLKIKSFDIDICTNATPKQIREIFKDACQPTDDYGSITLNIGKERYDLTTYRKDVKYFDHRRPEEIEYINDLKDDLLRRDFTINSICMNSKKQIIDLLNAKEDLKSKKINSIGDPYLKLTDDALRILRAVRFATILDFELSNQIKFSIKRTKKLLNEISYQRKRSELDKIFASKNVEKGIKLILELELDNILEITNIRNVKITKDLMGIWAQLGVENTYPFTKNELEIINNIKNILIKKTIDNETIYKYGLYVNLIAADILNINNKIVIKMNNRLQIKNRSEICITGQDIIKIINKEPGKYVTEILVDIEKKIINNELKNNKRSINKYIIKNYK